MQEEIQWRLGHKLHIEEFSICIPNISVLKEESLSKFSMRAHIVLIERNSSSIYEGYDQIFNITMILRLRRICTYEQYVDLETTQNIKIF